MNSYAAEQARIINIFLAWAYGVLVLLVLIGATMFPDEKPRDCEPQAVVNEGGGK